MNSHQVLSEDGGNDGLLTAMEVMGLNRAFFRTGTPNIVSSLWEVEDNATAYFMEHFYKKDSKTKRSAESIRYAYKETRKVYPNPFFWAAFQLNGVGN